MAKANIKLVTLNNIVFSIILLLILSLLHGIENLDPVSSAACLENYVSTVGIILLVPIFAPEEDKEINEIVFSKPMPQFKVYVIRILISLISIFALISVFAFILKYNNCDFPILKYILGTFSSAMFLGSVGLFLSAAAESTIVGYMASVGYLILNMMTKNKYLGNLFLFSMKYGSFTEKYYLLCGSIMLIFISVIIKSLKK